MRFVTGETETDIHIRSLTVAGWTGRNRAAVQHHIDELAALGVAPPSSVPLFYRTAASLLTQADEIEVLGLGTSGEAEPFLVHSGGTLWLGLGSDHTDRDLETVSVAASKQACAKPVAATLWRFADVADHIDDVTLHCDIADGDGWTRYQSGSLAAILPLSDLAARAGLGDGGALLCGTLAAIGGVRPAEAYRMRLTDPKLDREIRLDYRVQTLPLVS